MLSDLMSQLKKWEEALVSNMPRLRSFISAKKKEKDKTEVVGNIIKAQDAKSRLSKENKQVDIRLYYDERGLDRYGLLELGELVVSGRMLRVDTEMDGKKVYAKEIYKNPDKYFTEEVMQKLDDISKEEYSYG